MNRIGSWLTLVTMLCVLAAPGLVLGGQAVVTRVDQPDGCLRIRSGPSSSSAQIGCAEIGTRLRTVSDTARNDWIQIDRPVKGWVFGPQVRIEGRSTKPLPATTRPRRGSDDDQWFTDDFFRDERRRPRRYRDQSTDEVYRELDPYVGPRHPRSRLVPGLPVPPTPGQFRDRYRGLFPGGGR
ncbi:MAG: SH3 domain-containing protein [Thermodesulfobacteriota bacterium]